MDGNERDSFPERLVSQACHLVKEKEVNRAKRGARIASRLPDLGPPPVESAHCGLLGGSGLPEHAQDVRGSLSSPLARFWTLLHRFTVTPRVEEVGGFHGRVPRSGWGGAGCRDDFW